MNPIVEDFLNFGCVSDDNENKVLNGLEDLLNRLKGLLLNIAKNNFLIVWYCTSLLCSLFHFYLFQEMLNRL